MNSHALRHPALLVAATLALGAASARSEGDIRLGAAGWSQVSVVGHSSDTIGYDGFSRYSHNGKTQLGWGGQLSLESRVTDQLRIAAGVGIVAGHALRSYLDETTGYAPLWVGGYVSEASFAYRISGDATSGWMLRGGLFPYVYNPDVKNLGLYLLRGPVYPGFVISGFETKHVLPVANLAGLQLRHVAGNLTQDFILQSEMDYYPYFDLSPAYVATWRAHPAVELGAGVNFYHFIPVDGKLTNDKNYDYVKGDSLGNPVDTIPVSFKGIKLMARASFDPKHFFPATALGEEDLKLYGEVALIGLDHSDAHKDMYGELHHRMPVMVGFNLPVFGAFDHLSLEVQWYAAPFHDDMEPYLTGTNPPSPRPVGWGGTPTSNNNADKNVTRDNWKWSLHGARTIHDRVRVSAQVANDHWRPGIYIGDGDTNLPKRQAVLVSPKDWYFTGKIAWFF